VPPASSTAALMFGWSAAAQRGCWKLFHETAIVQSVDAASESSGSSDAVPPSVHAARTRARTARIAASLRMTMKDLLRSNIRPSSDGGTGNQATPVNALLIVVCFGGR